MQPSHAPSQRHPRSCASGLVLQERAAIEQEFGGGRLRCCCATVAFGMGVNIMRVDAVVHATLPRSLEEYVQQVRLWLRGALWLDC